MIVERYRPEASRAWNQFVADSRNGTFLLDRGYMDYHRDRFADHSLLIKNDDGSVAGLLPANERDGVLQSHAGLTYGGLILGEKSGVGATLDMLASIQRYLREHELGALHYKTIPWIYHRQPTEEDRYGLFRLGATLSRRDVLSVVPRDDRIRFQQRRARGVKSAHKSGVTVDQSPDYPAFWKILDDNLRSRYGVAPVHSLAEIETLRLAFPESIRLFVASRGGEPVAGTVIYESAQVAHVQYISANEEGKECHALDAIFDHLLNQVYAAKRFFDFGISNEDAGRVLNSGLVEQKEGFGARTVVHDHYHLDA